SSASSLAATDAVELDAPALARLELLEPEEEPRVVRLPAARCRAEDRHRPAVRVGLRAHAPLPVDEAERAHAGDHRAAVAHALIALVVPEVDDLPVGPHLPGRREIVADDADRAPGVRARRHRRLDAAPVRET